MVVLPTVSKETCLSVAQEMASDNLFLKNFYKRLKKTNPQIVLFVSALIRVRAIGDKKNVLIVAAAVYRMLESQAEANDLKELFNLK